ncbi:hypothetical protein B9867_18575 [Salmonella enterica]|nr:hypothetical protein [Salmonella enterica]EAZ4365621.1 hypothetical protein [Salmonella enterica]EAZ4415755.1 hypothetical protein [Salmonella enterica]EBA7492861.1 hypothetical protein [Salmonella enterica]EBA7515167.1 hypothetical protein [Salmonella enterica]
MMMVHSDNIFTLENVRTALAAYDYEQLHDEPIGWCLEYVQLLTDEQICASLRLVDVLDLIYSPPEIIRELVNPTGNTWQFIAAEATSSTDLAVATAALSGAFRTPGDDILAALAHLSGKALLRLHRETEIASAFDNLDEARKRRQLGGINRSKKYNGALRLQCQAWAHDIIARHKNEGRREPTKAALSRMVDDKYRAFITSYPKETQEFQKLHPPGREILPVGAGLAPNGSIYNWVKDMVNGQQRRGRKNPV